MSYKSVSKSLAALRVQIGALACPHEVSQWKFMADISRPYETGNDNRGPMMIINVLILLPQGKWVNGHFPSRSRVACQEMGANEANEAKVLCISRELKDER